MVEVSRPARADSPAIPKNATTVKRRVSVKKAMDEALQLYNTGKLESAERLCAQIVAGRPRMATAHDLMGVILNARGKRKEAVKAFQRAANLEPRNGHYLSNLGEIERLRGKLPEALAALTQAVSINPKLSKAQNNLGIVHFERREYDRAAKCYGKAIARRERFPEAHNNMGNALRMLGRQEEALEHYQKALLYRENYPEVYNNMASILRDQDQIAEAEQCYRKAIELRPKYLEAYSNLAGLMAENDQPVEALRILGDALRINPKYVPALVQTARAQLRLSNVEKAEQACRLALKHNPNSAEALSVLGQILHETDRFAEAVKCYERALELKPHLIEANNFLGVCLKSMGRWEEAKARFTKVIELNPRAFGTYSNLADLEKFEDSSPLLQKMQDLLPEGEERTSPRFMSLHFALGKAYEDLGHHDKAFEHFAAGAAIKRARVNYNENETFGHFERIRQTFDRAIFENRPFGGNPSPVPIFIVGMPRSGSTLIEQIIASHPAAFGAGEIKDLPRQLTALRNRFPALPQFPAMVKKLNSGQYELLAEAYLLKLRAYSPKAQRITDKLLSNCSFLGLIHLLFPRAKIIHTKRNAIDTCLSAYTKLFKDDMPYSYDLGELGRYYRKQEELMAHWRAVLPAGVMKAVSYEDVVEDLPRMAREVIGFLDLPWNEACLNFHASSRPVRTASVVQVRKPVYSSSVERWRRHEKELQPLLRALEDGGADVAKQRL
jgi:tetratricopeptide (TPR) repeat protein